MDTKTLRQACRVLERAIDNLDEAQTLQKYYQGHDTVEIDTTQKQNCVLAASEALRVCLERSV